MADIDVATLALLKKYSRPGPRYTSYPTAPVFSPSFSHADYTAEILASNAEESAPPLSLYFHIPFCDTLCYFCGCNMMVTRDRQKIRSYVDALIVEMELLRPLIRVDRPVTQIAWGGGTPTYLEPEEIRHLAEATQRIFPFAKNLEAGAEIDPRGMTRDHLLALWEGGFTRVSMGVQDFHPEVQEAVNRLQSEAMTREVIGWAREIGFTSLNLDLMYGLPHQTFDSFNHTLDTVIDINPDRIAVFNYAHVPWIKKHMSLIHPEDLPDAEVKLRIQLHTIAKLQAAGYEYIGMDHFAKPDNELAVAKRTRTLYRNFQGYTTHAGTDLYGFGITAISQFRRLYAQNTRTLPEYYRALEEGHPSTHVGLLLSDDDLLRRDVIMTLMCAFELSKPDFGERYGIDFDSYFGDAYPKLRDLIEDGCVSVEGDHIRVSPVGQLVIRNIAMAFDAYLPAQVQSKPLFSKTI